MYWAVLLFFEKPDSQNYGLKENIPVPHRGKPHLAFAASVYLINRIGTKTFVLVELPDQLHIRRIYPDSSSESSYPETSFTVLGNAAYKVFQQLAVGGVIMMNHLLAGKVYNEHPCVSPYPYLFILVF